RRGLAVAADPELGLAALAEAAGPDLALGLLRPELHHEGNPERRQGLSVEGLGALVVGDSEAEMIDDHGRALIASKTSVSASLSASRKVLRPINSGSISRMRSRRRSPYSSSRSSLRWK